MLADVTAVLTIAGSDSSGGAGIQADLRTFAAHACYGTSVVTALTAQNTTGVQGVHGTPPEFVAQQIRSVLDDIDVRAIKTGMLFTAENIRSIVSTLCGRSDRIPLVCDPVCVSTSGHALLQPDAVDIMIDELFPLSQIITPNQAEAELLLEAKGKPRKIATLSDMLEAARELLSIVPDREFEAVLLKGGHVIVSEDDVHRLPAQDGTTLNIKYVFLSRNDLEVLQRSDDNVERDWVVDVLCRRGRFTLYPRPRLQSTSTHGTGCTLSAAITCGLGRGLAVEEAVAQATAFTHLGIETATPIGSGYGPLNHLHPISILVVPLRTSSNRYPLVHKFIQDTSKLWNVYANHEYIVRLGNGTADLEQDDYPLEYYSKACKDFAITLCDVKPGSSAIEATLYSRINTTLTGTVESGATKAFADFLGEVISPNDVMKSCIGMVASLVGYGQVCRRLRNARWVSTREDVRRAVSVGLEIVEAHAAMYPPSSVQYKAWLSTWETSIRLQKEILDVAMERRRACTA